MKHKAKDVCKDIEERTSRLLWDIQSDYGGVVDEHGRDLIMGWMAVIFSDYLARLATGMAIDRGVKEELIEAHVKKTLATLAQNSIKQDVARMIAAKKDFDKAFPDGMPGTH